VGEKSLSEKNSEKTPPQAREARTQGGAGSEDAAEPQALLQVHDQRGAERRGVRVLQADQLAGGGCGLLGVVVVVASSHGSVL
jgi:hypothetical protein